MNEVAKEQKIDFIINTGDNYYDNQEEEDRGLNDKAWDEHWVSIY